MPHKMLFFEAGIDFSYPATVAICLRDGNCVDQWGRLSPTRNKRRFTILQSLIPLHGIDASNNQFHNGIDFSQGVDSVESMPRALQRLKNQAQIRFGYLGIGQSRRESIRPLGEQGEALC
jgi:hypothetical protein